MERQRRAGERGAAGRRAVLSNRGRRSASAQRDGYTRKSPLLDGESYTPHRRDSSARHLGNPQPILAPSAECHAACKACDWLEAKSFSDGASPREKRRRNGLVTPVFAVLYWCQK